VKENEFSTSRIYTSNVTHSLMMLYLLDFFKTNRVHSVLSKKTQRVEESLNITFDEGSPPSKISSLVDDDSVESPMMARQAWNKSTK
jgi:hypothetical protein